MFDKARSGSPTFAKVGCDSLRFTGVRCGSYDAVRFAQVRSGSLRFAIVRQSSQGRSPRCDEVR